MEEIFKILRNALPEAIGGLIAAGIIALLSYLFIRRFRKEPPPTNLTKELLPEPNVPEIYSNLPSRTEFIGRKKEMERVKEALNSRYFLICIDGIGGIGKTSLALEVIHECLRFSRGEIIIKDEKQIESAIPKFDGFIWTSAKDRELRLNDILDAIARTLDWPGIAQQPHEEKIESVRKLLQTKRYLLIVDNFETITDEAVRDFLLKIPEPSKVLITSREQKLPQAWAVSIKGLEQDEALALIRNEGQRLGLRSVEDADDQLLLRLYQATGGAPLAIKWSVGQIKQKGQSLDTVLAALHEAKGDIFEEVFARSWSLLSEDAQKVLMVMPIFAASASRDAIEAASDVHHFALDEALGQLVQMWMVEVTDELESAKRRYNVHPLTRAYAKAIRKGDEQFDKAAAIRISDYYLELVKKYGGIKIEYFDVLEIEKENIITIIDKCFNTAQWKKALFLTRETQYFLLIRGFWQEIIQYTPLEIDAANLIGDLDSIGNIYIFKKGWMHFIKEEYSQAKNFLQKGISRSIESGNLKRVGYGKRYLGMIVNEEGKIDKAKELTQEALDIAEQEKELCLKYMIYSDFGVIEFKLKNYKTAESWYRQAITGLKNLGRFELVTTRLVLLGNVLLTENKLDESHETYQECLNLSQKYKRQDNIARAKLGIAKLNELQNNRSEALKLANEALISFQKLGMKKFINEAKEMIDRLEKKLRK